MGCLQRYFPEKGEPALRKTGADTAFFPGCFLRIIQTDRNSFPNHNQQIGKILFPVGSASAFRLPSLREAMLLP
jgi:hypothetical protein